MKLATNDGRLHIADCAHVYASPPGQLTAPLATEWAQHTDLISVNPGQYDALTMTLVAKYAHPGIYTKADHDTNGTLPEDNYAHHWDGVTLLRKANKAYSPPVFIMQPDSAWRAKHQQDLLDLKARYPWCSWVFKDTARASYDIGGPPVNPNLAGHVTYKRYEWENLLRSNFEQWDAALGYPLVCINGLAADTVTAFQPDPPDRNWGGIGMIEGAFGLLDGSLPTEGAWGAIGDLVWSAQFLGWTPWLYAKLRETTGTFADRARRLSVASAYLWDRGSLLYLYGGVEQSAPSWVTREYLHECYRPAIGLPGMVPTDWRSYQRPEGAYVKVYSSGRVIVNPTSAPVTVKLTVDHTEHTVPAMDAMILRRTTSGWTRVL